MSGLKFTPLVTWSYPTPVVPSVQAESLKVRFCHPPMALVGTRAFAGAPAATITVSDFTLPTALIESCSGDDRTPGGALNLGAGLSCESIHAVRSVR